MAQLTSPTSAFPSPSLSLPPGSQTYKATCHEWLPSYSERHATDPPYGRQNKATYMLSAVSYCRQVPMNADALIIQSRVRLDSYRKISILLLGRYGDNPPQVYRHSTFPTIIPSVPRQTLAPHGTMLVNSPSGTSVGGHGCQCYRLRAWLYMR
jgi:hypothetical protein